MGEWVVLRGAPANTLTGFEEAVVDSSACVRICDVVLEIENVGMYI